MKVEPIRAVRDIRAIKRMLGQSPRDLAIFVVGVNTNLRASDILALTVGHVRGLDVGGDIVLKEKKTGKQRRITANAEIADAIGKLLAAREGGDRALSDHEPLFVGQRGRLTVPTLSRMVKNWCEMVNLTGNYAAHSMRKTWGYHQRVRLNTSVPELMVMFNHSSQRQTLDYLGVQPEEIKEAYLKLSY